VGGWSGGTRRGGLNRRRRSYGTWSRRNFLDEVGVRWCGITRAAPAVVVPRTAATSTAPSVLLGVRAAASAGDTKQKYIMSRGSSQREHINIQLTFE
jgi:hypothetical protein